MVGRWIVNALPLKNNIIMVEQFLYEEEFPISPAFFC